MYVYVTHFAVSCVFSNSLQKVVIWSCFLYIIRRISKMERQVFLGPAMATWPLIGQVTWPPCVRVEGCPGARALCGQRVRRAFRHQRQAISSTKVSLSMRARWLRFCCCSWWVVYYLGDLCTFVTRIMSLIYFIVTSSQSEPPNQSLQNGGNHSSLSTGDGSASPFRPTSLLKKISFIDSSDSCSSTSSKEPYTQENIISGPPPLSSATTSATTNGTSVTTTSNQIGNGSLSRKKLLNSMDTAGMPLPTLTTVNVITQQPTALSPLTDIAIISSTASGHELTTSIATSASSSLGSSSLPIIHQSGHNHLTSTTATNNHSHHSSSKVQVKTESPGRHPRAAWTCDPDEIIQITGDSHEIRYVQHSITTSIRFKLNCKRFKIHLNWRWLH